MLLRLIAGVTGICALVGATETAKRVAVLINQEYLRWFPINGTISFGNTTVRQVILGDSIFCLVITVIGIFLCGWAIRWSGSKGDSERDLSNPYSASQIE